MGRDVAQAADSDVGGEPGEADGVGVDGGGVTREGGEAEIGVKG